MWHARRRSAGICAALTARYLTLRRSRADSRQQLKCINQLKQEANTMNELNQQGVFGHEIAESERARCCEDMGNVGLMT
eukprot:5262220-Pyramimonas_sp.AAC.1